jgi:hypothetical protein
MRTNYLLIDFENVHVASLALLNGHPFKVLIFIGANQTKIPIELAKGVQALGANAEYIQISGNGPNALDFHIAFVIGQLSTREPDAFFHIISKDTGFDPLIEFAKKQKLHMLRSRELVEIPLLRLSNAKSVAEKVDAVVKNLAVRGSGRPRKVSTLSNTINALFQKSLEKSELEALVQALQKGGHISIEKENVTYHLPPVP